MVFFGPGYGEQDWSLDLSANTGKKNMPLKIISLNESSNLHAQESLS